MMVYLLTKGKARNNQGWGCATSVNNAALLAFLTGMYWAVKYPAWEVTS